MERFDEWWETSWRKGHLVALAVDLLADMEGMRQTINFGTAGLALLVKSLRDSIQVVLTSTMTTCTCLWWLVVRVVKHVLSDDGCTDLASLMVTCAKYTHHWNEMVEVLEALRHAGVKMSKGWAEMLNDVPMLSMWLAFVARYMKVMSSVGAHDWRQPHPDLPELKAFALAARLAPAACHNASAWADLETCKKQLMDQLVHPTPPSRVSDVQCRACRSIPCPSPA